MLLLQRARNTHTKGKRIAVNLNSSSPYAGGICTDREVHVDTSVAADQGPGLFSSLLWQPGAGLPPWESAPPAKGACSQGLPSPVGEASGVYWPGRPPSLAGTCLSTCCVRQRAPNTFPAIVWGWGERSAFMQPGVSGWDRPIPAAAKVAREQW